MYSKKRQICKYGKYLIVTTPISNKILSRWLSSSSSSSVICQTTGRKPLPKRFLHTERSRASCFNWEYPLLSLRASSSFLRLLPRLLVTFICPFIFPSITCCRTQFLRKTWPIQLAGVTWKFFHGATALSRPGPPHYHDFTITLRHTILTR